AHAARAFAQLGAHAQREHRVLDADQAWQGALRNLDDGAAPYAHALIGRARARYRLQRVNEALADLARSLEIAQAVGDAGLQLEALLEQATALDWTQDFTSSRGVAEAAIRHYQRDPQRHASFSIDVEFAAARIAFREQEPGAEVQLRDVVARARAAGNLGAEIDAAVLLGCVLVGQGCLDEAEAVLDRTIAMCEESGDRFHLGAAYNNRTLLWSARGEIERVAGDLRVVIQLAREAGQAFVERAATWNLAEDRLWQGALDEALLLGRRSLALQQGHGEGSTRLDEMLLARIYAARGQRSELATTLAAVTLHALDDDERRLAAVLQASIADEGLAAWDRALDDAKALPPPYQLEMLHLAARQGGLSPERREYLRTLAEADPIWSRRLAEL
ncbi:MAG: hypothetical protein M3680_25905, partial [Myxococcota bacterium]|nr:hypothetical protein [Myxococcota bacterium]